MTHADEQQMRETLVSAYRDLVEMGLMDQAKKVAYTKFISVRTCTG